MIYLSNGLLQKQQDNSALEKCEDIKEVLRSVKGQTRQLYKEKSLKIPKGLIRIRKSETAQ